MTKRLFVCKPKHKTTGNTLASINVTETLYAHLRWVNACARVSQ